MLGWEFPPFNTGGLGTACYGITKGLTNNGVKVTFVLPRIPKRFKEKNSLEIKKESERLNIIIAEEETNIKKIIVPALLIPYITRTRYAELIKEGKQPSKGELYGEDLFQEVIRYKELIKELYKKGILGEFDIIHAHDWMTYLAAIELKRISKKPLVVHVHATEFDRNGMNSGNQRVHEIEKEGMEKADRVITVSNYTKGIVISKYGISPNKVITVHNAVEFNNCQLNENFEIKKHDKVVLFLGRITLQKGPDYFVKAAKLVSEKIPNTKFVVVGKGDMEAQMINEVVRLGLASKFLFAGFLRGKDIDRAYKMADVYVMPSVSEPFGITPLEAMRNGTPSIISKQSGVSEVVNNCLKVDFWDVNEMANKIIAVLKYEPLKKELRRQGSLEIKKFNWNEPARKIIEVYKEAMKEEK